MPLWSARRMIHSASLRAVGSEMPAATSVALLAPPLRSASIVLLTSAIWLSAVSGVGPCASGICATVSPRDPTLLSLLSLDFSFAAFVAAALPALSAALSAALSVAAGLAVLSAGFSAVLVVAVGALLARRAASAVKVAASRLAQASAATSAERCDRVKRLVPNPPADGRAPG